MVRDGRTDIVVSTTRTGDRVAAQARWRLQSREHRQRRTGDGQETDRGVVHSPKPHPLRPCLKMANECLQRVQEIRDYTCVLVKRERVKGRLGAPEYIRAKVRHDRNMAETDAAPFSIYMKFYRPNRLAGREVLFVKGHHDDQMLVRKGGRGFPSLTTSLDPEGILAMRENRYPITEFGLQRLIERMIEIGTSESEYGECIVRISEGAEVDDRTCTCIEIEHPQMRDYFQYHLARLYLDDELQVPIRFESYDWPDEENQGPLLKEEYTYCRLKLNVGLTDADFDRDNPTYGFSPE